jgi:hypothetical protein
MARPRELVDAERLSAWVQRLEPNPSVALRLAARCQHVRRWEIPRETYPEGRSGYLRWRADLARFHAGIAERVLRDSGFDEQTLEAVRRIQLKQGLGKPGDSQTMEDALCLSFLEHELSDFTAKHDAPTLERILRKTWKKMSPRAKALAQTLTFPAEISQLIERATAGHAGSSS